MDSAATRFDALERALDGIEQSILPGLARALEAFLDASAESRSEQESGACSASVHGLGAELSTLTGQVAVALGPRLRGQSRKGARSA
jgi:hypothetical protein